MPCMGPYYPSETDIDIVYNDVLKLLQEKYYVFKFPPHTLSLGDNKKFRSEILHNLRKVIEAAIWQQNCEDF